MRFVKRVLSISFPYLFILVTVLLLLRTFVHPGVPVTHDGENHLARMANFYLAIEDGQIPPRWAPNLNYQYGYPVFHYNYYLVYIPGILFYKIGFDLETSMKLVTGMSFLGGGIFMYLFLQFFITRGAALVGAILYLSSPQYLSQIFVRGNVGEVVGWALLPVGLWSVQQILKTVPDKRQLWLWQVVLALVIAALALAHNVLFLFGVPLWMGYALTALLTQTSSGWTAIKIFGTSMFFPLALGIGLVMYFWLPAYWELDLITLADVQLSKQFLDHVVYLDQLVVDEWGYHYSQLGREDGMSFEIGRFHWLVLALGVLGFIARYVMTIKKTSLLNSIKALRNYSPKRSVTEASKLGGYFVVVFGVSVYLMTPYGVWYWQLFPKLQQIQFPWRLMGVAVLGISVLGALSVDSLIRYWMQNKWAAWGLTILVIGMTLGYSYPLATPQGYLNQLDHYHFLFPFTSSVNHENLPRGFNMTQNSEYHTKLASIKGSATFEEEQWSSSEHRYTVHALTPATIVERLAYFPGWTTVVDNQPVTITTTHPEFPGMPIYEVEPGKHQVRTIWRESTLPRQLGDAISLTSLGLLIGFCGWKLLLLNQGSRHNTNPLV